MAETVVQDPVQPNPTEQDIRKAMDDAATQAALADPTKPIELKLPTGAVFKGTPKEVIDSLAKSVEEGSAERKRQKDELARMQQELEQLRQRPAPVEPADETQYDHQKYLALLAEDARKAQQYVDRFDSDKQELQQEVAKARSAREAETFKSNVGWFAPTQEEAVAFGQEFARVRNALSTQGKAFEPTAENYELVYHRLVNQGKIKAPAISGVQGHQAPPPVIAGGGGSAPSGMEDLIANFEFMPANQQEVVLRKLEAMGYFKKK